MDTKCGTCKGISENGACSYCRRRFTKMTRELVSYVTLLRSQPALRQQVSTQQEGRGSGNHSLVINVQIVDMISRHGVEAVLKEWATMVVDERDLNHGLLKPTQQEDTIHRYKAVLMAHVDWLGDHEAWPDLYLEIKEPWSTLKRIILGERKPPAPVPCPVVECTGHLILQRNGDVHCHEDDSHAWVYEQWSRLALLIADS